MTDEPQLPRDEVPPGARISDSATHTANKLVSALEKPGSVLLFAIVLFLIAAGADWVNTSKRMDTMGKWLGLIEDHRYEEMQRCQNSVTSIVEACLRGLTGKEQ